jgi:hypothetical protein
MPDDGGGGAAAIGHTLQRQLLALAAHQRAGHVAQRAQLHVVRRNWKQHVHTVRKGHARNISSELIHILLLKIQKACNIIEIVHNISASVRYLGAKYDITNYFLKYY